MALHKPPRAPDRQALDLLDYPRGRFRPSGIGRLVDVNAYPREAAQERPDEALGFDQHGNVAPPLLARHERANGAAEWKNEGPRRVFFLPNFCRSNSSHSRLKASSSTTLAGPLDIVAAPGDNVWEMTLRGSRNEVTPRAKAVEQDLPLWTRELLGVLTTQERNAFVSRAAGLVSS
jgi:hypothetical protein